MCSVDTCTAREIDPQSSCRCLCILPGTRPINGSAPSQSRKRCNTIINARLKCHDNNHSSFLMTCMRRSSSILFNRLCTPPSWYSPTAHAITSRWSTTPTSPPAASHVKIWRWRYIMIRLWPHTRIGPYKPIIYTRIYLRVAAAGSLLKACGSTSAVRGPVHWAASSTSEAISLGPCEWMIANW